MHLSTAVIIIALGFTSAYFVEPPTTADPTTDPTCEVWGVALENDDCRSMCGRNSQSLWYFGNMNPSNKKVPGCKLVAGQSYCLGASH